MIENKKKFIVGLGLLIVAGILLSLMILQKIFNPNVNIEKTYLYIKTGSDYKEVLISLKNQKILKNINDFNWWAKFKGYPESIKSGKYFFHKGMNNYQIVNMLRTGRQTPVNLVINNIRTIEQLAGKISNQIELDSVSLIEYFKNEQKLSVYGLNTEEVKLIFIPNTYQIWWNIGIEKLMQRMNNEYHKFWNSNRTEKAEKIGLNLKEISILASIVEEESLKNDEKPTIASVYLNRLKKGMLLQADPTVKFALNDFTIKRVLKKHTEVESPYNTYKYNGLPPGPICIPSISSIDAVLENKQTDYLFFCAKEDHSGYHNFAKNENEHFNNARKYHKTLNQLKIY